MIADIKKTLWAVDKLRANMDAAEYKYVSDTFQARRDDLAKRYVVYFVPENTRHV
jgi:hypothetical protein